MAHQNDINSCYVPGQYPLFERSLRGRFRWFSDPDGHRWLSDPSSEVPHSHNISGALSTKAEQSAPELYSRSAKASPEVEGWGKTLIGIQAPMSQRPSYQGERDILIHGNQIRHPFLSITMHDRQDPWLNPLPGFRSSPQPAASR